MPKYTTPLSLETSGIKISDPSNPTFVLVTESGEGTVKQRNYNSPDGFVWTFNAYWVEGSSTWERDDISTVSEMCTYRPNYDVPLRIQRVLGSSGSITWNSAESLTPTKAWANVATSAGPTATTVSSNISLVSFPSATVMRLTFQRAMDTSQYVVHGSVDYPAALYVEAYNTNYVDVKYAYISSGADVDFGSLLRNYSISVVCHPYRALIS